MKRYILSMLMVLSFAFYCNSQDDQFEAMQDIINSGEFVFTANKAQPQAGSIVDLTTNPNYVRVKGGEAEAELPYFGTMHSVVDPSGDVGIKFSGPLENYKIEINEKKMQINISFKAKASGETFSCYMVVSDSGFATLDVQGSRRSYISYNGEIEPVEE